MRKICMAIIFIYILATVLSACSTTPPEVSSGDTPPTASSSSTGETGSATESSFTTKNTTTATKEKASATKGTSSGTTTTSATTTVSTTSGTRKTYVTYAPTILDFSNLAAYKEKLLTFNSKDAMEQVYEKANANRNHDEFHDEAFPMLLEDRFFLLPNMPEGYALTAVAFDYRGWTKFYIKSLSGVEINITMYHNSRKASREEDDLVITNNRGMTLLKEVGRYEAWYTWQEEGHVCNVFGPVEKEQEIETFAKALTFEKVAIK